MGGTKGGKGGGCRINFGLGCGLPNLKLSTFSSFLTSYVV